MPSAAEMIQLTVSEAACLNAVNDGLDGKSRIAIETRKDLKTVAELLEKLNRARLIRRAETRRWCPTDYGQNCTVQVVPDSGRRRSGKTYGRLIPGSAAEQLLKALDQPKRGVELVERLGVTPQRIHQLVVKLHAQGRLRFGDRRKILHIVARSEDASLLLTHNEERILSALPDDDATTVARLAAAAHMMPAAASHAVAQLNEKGLIVEAGSDRGQTHYRLGTEGRVHFQRRASARRADPFPLKVRSDRVRRVLSYLDERGVARIKDVGETLSISQASINALMQYLKRKGLVRKTSRELSAPYELTVEGRDILAEMIRRS